MVAAVADLSDVEAGGETLFPLLHAKDMPFPAFLEREPSDLRKVSAFLDGSGRVTSEQSEHKRPSSILVVVGRELPERCDSQRSLCGLICLASVSLWFCLCLSVVLPLSLPACRQDQQPCEPTLRISELH